MSLATVVENCPTLRHHLNDESSEVQGPPVVVPSHVEAKTIYPLMDKNLQPVKSNLYEEIETM